MLFRRIYNIYFYIKGVLLNNNHIFAEITREIHVINDFRVKTLIKINIFILERIIINFITQFNEIDNYRNIIISINSRTRFELIKRTIKSFNKIFLLLYIIILILIIYVKTLLKNKDLFFELSYLLSLDYINKIYIYIINTFFEKYIYVTILIR